MPNDDRGALVSVGGSPLAIVLAGVLAIVLAGAAGFRALSRVRPRQGYDGAPDR